MSNKCFFSDCVVKTWNLVLQAYNASDSGFLFISLSSETVTHHKVDRLSWLKVTSLVWYCSSAVTFCPFFLHFQRKFYIWSLLWIRTAEPSVIYIWLLWVTTLMCVAEGVCEWGVCDCVCDCVCVCVYVCVCLSVCLSVSLSVCLCLCLCVCECTPILVCECVYACVCVCLHVCVCVCVFVFVHSRLHVWVTNNSFT